LFSRAEIVHSLYKRVNTGIGQRSQLDDEQAGKQTEQIQN